jgi:RNA polymerase sigma factor (sigma-70 family)
MSTANLEHLIRRVDELADDDVLLQRFLTHRDAAAFEALLCRHGPRVLAVCRRLLPTDDDDDAFQATFLCLLRQASAIRDRRNLRGWLLTVAHRVSMLALRRAKRRREAAGVEPATPPADPSWREACVILHEEVDRLPERLRRPLVLCYFEGFSRDEAAEQLGWSAGTVKGRLERGRLLLKARLTRRGIALAAGALMLTGRELIASVPAPLVQSTLSLAAGGPITPALTALLPAARMGLGRRAAIIAGVVLLIGVAGIVGRPGPKVAKAMPAEPPAPPAEPAETTVLRGKVLGPDGKPFAGAKLSLDGEKDLGISKDDGTFAVQIAAEQMSGQTLWALLATAKGYAPGWVHLPTESTEVTLRLAKDDVPIQGRILDLEGRPLAGVKVELAMLVADNVDELLGLVPRPQPKPGEDFRKQLLERHISLKTSVANRIASAITDADGRFRLDGVGRDRYVGLRLTGPTIRQILVQVTTMDPLPPLPSGRPRRSPLPAKFEYSAAPGRVLRGVVREKGSGMPIAGARVFYEETIQSTTDPQGRYEIAGLPKTAKIHVQIWAPVETHFGTSEDVLDQPGIGPLTKDFELLRGITVRGRVLDAVTKKPLKATVHYRALGPNPHIRTAPGGDRLDGFFTGPTQTKDDGSFAVAALPGPGAVLVNVPSGYQDAYVDPTKFFGVETKEGAAPFGNNTVLELALGGDRSIPQQQAEFRGIVLLNPPVGSGPLERDVMLQPEVPLTVELRDPEGNPLAGAQVRGASYRHRLWESQKTAIVAIEGWCPQRPRVLEFRHDARKLVGHVELNATTRSPLRVILQPWAELRGRLVGPDGKPLANAAVYSDGLKSPGGVSFGFVNFDRRPTDAEGRFHLTALSPGVEYRFLFSTSRAPILNGSLPDPITLKPGESRDLGDVRAKPRAMN